MSRTTDQVRGARMASAIAHLQLVQPQLFSDDVLDAAFWKSIERAAADVLEEHAACEAILRAGS